MSHVITCDDKTAARVRKEKEILESERSVLVSVNIYKEGADLPPIDGVCILRSS